MLLAGYPGSTPEIKLLRGLIVSLLLVVSNRLYLKEYDTLSTADLRPRSEGTSRADYWGIDWSVGGDFLSQTL